MKKVYLIISLICLGFLFLTSSIIIDAYTKTGHEDFREIIFVEEGCLIVDYEESFLEDEIKNLKKKFIGWETKELNSNVYVEFVGPPIFVKSNTTKSSYEFEYVLKETETTTTSVTVKGSVSLKITGNIKKSTSIVGNGEISGQYENKNVYVTDAKTTINVSIKPNRKISLVTLGDAYITNGVSRYTFFRITFRSGSWERIETNVIYYELREEKV